MSEKKIMDMFELTNEEVLRIMDDVELNERQVRVLTERMNGTSYRELAAIEGVSDSALRESVRRALRKVGYKKSLVKSNKEEQTIQDVLTDDTHVYRLDISIRAKNALVRGGINTYGELKVKMQDPENLMGHLRNVGEKTIQELSEFIRGVKPGQPMELTLDDIYYGATFVDEYNGIFMLIENAMERETPPFYLLIDLDKYQVIEIETKEDMLDILEDKKMEPRKIQIKASKISKKLGIKIEPNLVKYKVDFYEGLWKKPFGNKHIATVELEADPKLVERQIISMALEKVTVPYPRSYHAEVTKIEDKNS
jgi:hypothetical protein